MVDRIERENDGARRARRVMFDAVTGERVEVDEDPSITIEGRASGFWKRLAGRGSSGQAQAMPGSASDPAVASRIDDYLDMIRKWTSGAEFAANAEQVEQLKQERIAAAAELAQLGLIAHPALRHVAPYLAADVAYNSRPRPEEESYAQFVEHRAKMRDMISKDNLIGAEAYVRSARVTQRMMVAGTHIDDQYDLIELRRESALESFNDPRFVVDVGEVAGGAYRDELLVDFDRSDLMGRAARTRSKAMSDVFLDTIATRKQAGDGHAMAASFMAMREAGAAIRDDHQALFNFGDATGGDAAARALGLVALEAPVYSTEMVKDFCSELPGSYSERRQAWGRIRTLPGIFHEARLDFERRFAAGDPKCARAFAVMEKAAGDIFKSQHEISVLTRDSLDDAAVLFMFSPEGKARYRDPVAASVEERTIATMKQKGAYATLGERGISARGVDKKGEHFTLEMTEPGQGVHIETVDGGRIRISRSAEDAAAGRFIEGRLADLAVPKRGVMSKDGSLDAGEAAKAHLDHLIERHGVRGLGITMSDDKDGHRTIRLTLPTGEDVSQKMIRDGYGVPLEDHALRHEMLAKSAEAGRRGLWKNGFVDQKSDWRAEAHRPGLSNRDKQSGLAHRRSGTVAKAMAGNANDVARRLTSVETKIFALPLERWSGLGAVDREVMKVAATSPGRLMDIYASNIEILEGLRERKQKLTDHEKLAHDRLTIGANSLAKALVRTGHLDEAVAAGNHHGLMSQKSLTLPKDLLERPINAAAYTAEKGAKTVAEGARYTKSILAAAQAWGLQ